MNNIIKVRDFYIEENNDEEIIEEIDELEEDENKGYEIIKETLDSLDPNKEEDNIILKFIDKINRRFNRLVVFELDKDCKGIIDKKEEFTNVLIELTNKYGYTNPEYLILNNIGISLALKYNKASAVIANEIIRMEGYKDLHHIFDSELSGYSMVFINGTGGIVFTNYLK